MAYFERIALASVRIAAASPALLSNLTLNLR